MTKFETRRTDISAIDNFERATLWIGKLDLNELLSEKKKEKINKRKNLNYS